MNSPDKQDDSGQNVEDRQAEPKRNALADLTANVPRGWQRTASVILAVSIVGVCLYYLGRNMAPLLDDLSWLGNIRWQYAALALGLFATGNLLGGALWYFLLTSMRQVCKLGGCIWASTTSILAKYLPGSAWQMAGRVYLTSRMGPGIRILGSATLLDLGTKTLSALFLSALLVPTEILQRAFGIPEWAVLLIAVFSLASMTGIPLASKLGFVRRSPRISRWLPLVSARLYWATCIAMMFTWGVNAAAFAFLVQALQSISPTQWLLSAASLPLSITAGTFAPFAPAGLGVREAVLAATVGSAVSPAIASAAAIASRLVMIIADMVALSIVTLLRKPLAGEIARLTHMD